MSGASSNYKALWDLVYARLLVIDYEFTMTVNLLLVSAMPSLTYRPR